jgi:hypothetical protein
MSLNVPPQLNIGGTGPLAFPVRTLPPGQLPTPDSTPFAPAADPAVLADTTSVAISFAGRSSAAMDPLSGLTNFDRPALNPVSVETEGDPAAEASLPGAALVSKLGLTASRTATAYNAVSTGAQTGIVAPMPAPPQADTGPADVKGAKANTATIAGTVRHTTNLLDGNLTGGDVVAVGDLANTAAGLVHNRGSSEATARLVQRAGGLAAGAGVAGFAVNLASQDYGQIGQNVQAVLADPGNEELRTQAVADGRGLATGVQDLVNAARGAVPTLDAARGTLGAATTTAGRIAERAVGPGMRAAATAGRMAGRFAPGVNIAVAALDTAVAVNDIARARANPTRDNVVNATFSSVTALGSVAAASNIPVVSQVGAAVSMASDAGKLVYNNRAAIARETSRAVTATRTYVRTQATRAVTAVAESRPVRQAVRAAAATRAYVNNQASRAVAAVAQSSAGRQAARAYNWARSWF